jgi:NAD(P)-dependent dehydrogenase (short-subunit alcohol dehydrogenase family)
VQAKEAKAPPTPKIWTHERCLPIRCDVRLKPQIETAVKKTLEHFGRLDIVVKYIPPGKGVDDSCAGWGILGACEEQTDYELRSQFETNVYGTFNVIRMTLPLLRGRDSARFINLTSTSSLLVED